MALYPFHNNLTGKIETLSLSHLRFQSYENNDKLGILELLAKITLLDNNVSCKISQQQINPNFDYKTIYNHIYDILSPNIMQRLVVERIIDHNIRKEKKLHFDINGQLLLNLHGERGDSKTHIVKALEMGFAFLGQGEELVIYELIRCVADSIVESTVHTAVGVNTCHNTSFVSKTSIK